MRILVTGSDGFIGQNLVYKLAEYDDLVIDTFTHHDALESLGKKVLHADVIIHLAGMNRPDNNDEFITVNIGLTEHLCNLLADLGHSPYIIFASSTQAVLDNPYGKSKLQAEKVLSAFADKNDGRITIYRLPNIFGKWCRPNYNSVVATFCHRIVNGLDIEIHDRNANITLVYIDDLLDCFLEDIHGDQKAGCEIVDIPKYYETTVGVLADILYGFQHSRDSLLIEEVGKGLKRALYSTYLSYMKPDQFSYPLKPHTDERGSFVEILKTHTSGQFSYLTAKPGVTRGGHYHHTKSEKFLVVQGRALFKFRNLRNNTIKTIESDSSKPTIVETIPGWVHDITNISDTELIVLLWANELFDKDNPDTITAEVDG